MSGSDFERLKPLCVELTKQQNIGNVKHLNNCLRMCHGLQTLQEYVLFPLILVFKKAEPSPVNLKTEVALTMHLVFQKTSVEKIELFQDVFNCLCFSISDPKNQGKVLEIAEEYKLAVATCLTTLFNSLSHELFSEVYSVKFLPPLGHAVSLLLHMAEHEQNRDLRVQALRCLHNVAQIDKKLGAKQKERIGDTFAAFLPGISMALCRIITGDTKQGHAITCAAIDGWHNIVCRVINDSCLRKSNTAKSVPQKERTSKYPKLSVSRTGEWVKQTADKLQVLSARIKGVASHSNWRVKMAMVYWAKALLTNCQQSLPVCVSHCLEVLIALVADDYENIATASQAVLHDFQNSSRDSNRALVEVLEENLHLLATHFPRQIRSVDEKEKLHNVKMLNGYVKLLAPSLHTVMYSYTHLHRLSHSLLQALELDCTSIAVIQEKSTGMLARLGTDTLYQNTRKQFVHFRDDNIFKELQSLCRTLGHYGDIEVLIDHFLDLFDQSSISRKQTILIMNELCYGIIHGNVKLGTASSQNTANSQSKESLSALIKSLLNVYLCTDYIDLPTTSQVSDNKLDKISKGDSDWQIVQVRSPPSCNLRELNSNIIQVCLLLEGVGIFAQVAGEEFKYMLMDVLYPVLEKIGSDNAAVSQTALLTLQQIASACAYSCTEDLLSANADYLVNSISLRMRHLSRHPTSPLVLCVILTYSDKSILPLMEDTISETLNALDTHYEDVGLPFMKILHSLTLFIRKWFPCDPVAISITESSGKESQMPKSALEVKSFLVDYMNHKSIASGEAENYHIHDENDNDVIQCDEEDDTDNEKEQPYHVTKISQVLERCIHLLGCSDVHLRLLTLDTIAEGLLALQTHQNVLLPLVHRLWAPLLPRLTDQHMLVILKACKVLSVFAQVSKDFIRQRVVKDVFPKLILFLNKQHHTSLKVGPVYHHSLGCKLQLTILRDVGRLCALVGAGEHQITGVLNACMPYLNARQPQILQQACVETLCEIAKIEPDTVWLFCNNIYLSNLPSPPDDRFHDVKLRGCQMKNEFTENIAAILKCCS